MWHTQQDKLELGKALGLGGCTGMSHGVIGYGGLARATRGTSWELEGDERGELLRAGV